MNQYETVFIITPVLSDEDIKNTIERYKKFLIQNSAEIIYEENWGLRKLAYSIKRKNNGYYYLIEYKSEGELVKKLEIEFLRDERIMRFLTVKLDKYAIIYNEKKRAKKEETQNVEENKP